MDTLRCPWALHQCGKEMFLVSSEECWFLHTWNVLNVSLYIFKFWLCLVCMAACVVYNSEVNIHQWCSSLSSVPVSRGYAALLVKGYGTSGCTVPSSRPAHGSRLRSGRWSRWLLQPYHNLHDLCCLQREHKWWGLSGEAGYHLTRDAWYAVTRSRFDLRLWLIFMCMRMIRCC